MAYCSETILDLGQESIWGWMEVLGVDDGGPSLLPPTTPASPELPSWKGALDIFFRNLLILSDMY